MDLQTNYDPSLAMQSALVTKAEAMAQAADSMDDAKAQKVAEGFESIFVNILFKQMRKATGGKGLFGDDAGSKMYREMLDTALSDAMAKSNQLGLARAIYEQLRKQT